MRHALGIWDVLQPELRLFFVFFVAPASSDPVPSAGWGGSVTTRSRTTSPENRSKEVRMSTMHCSDLSPVASTRPSILAHLRAHIERSNVQRLSLRRGKGSSTSWTHSDTSYTDVRPCRLGPNLPRLRQARFAFCLPQTPPRWRQSIFCGLCRWTTSSSGTSAIRHVFGSP